MNIILKIKNLKLTESFKTFIKEKIGGILKLLKGFNKNKTNNQQDATEIFVEVEKETTHHKKGSIFKAEAKVNLPGRSFIAEAHGDDLGRAVTEVRDGLERKIRKYKTRTVDMPRRKERRRKGLFKFWQ
mgnify:FL=1